MAALMEGRVFSSISNEMDILAVAELPDEEEIILSFRKKTINIMKVANQKTECSWSVRHGVTLTSPVLWDSLNERFIAVTNSQEVKYWDKDTKDFEKAKKKQSSTTIHATLVVEGKEPILLYSNGNVSFLAEIKNDHSSGCLTTSASIVWYAASVLHTTPTVVFVTKTENVVTLYRQTYNEETGLWTCTQEKISGGKLPLVSCDGLLNNNTIEIFFLWSDQMLSSVTVATDSIIHSSFDQFVQGAQTCSSIVVVDNSHVAVARVKQGGQEGICIHNTMFQLQQAWQSLPEKPNSQLKVFYVRGQLFVPCGHTLYTYGVDCQPSTIGSVMAQYTGQSNQQPAFSGVTWNTNMNDCSSQTQEELLNLFTEASNCKHNYKSFQDAFSKLTVELNKSGNTHWLMSSHMTSLVGFMVDQTKFWACGELKQLIDKKCIPPSCLTRVMDALIHHTEVGLVHQLIRNSSNLSERCLATAVDFYIQCEDDLIKSAVQELFRGSIEIQQHCPISPQLAFLIDCVLACPYSDVFLLESLRKVSFKNALKLLEYLGYKLECMSAAPESDGRSAGLSQSEVVDWMCLVIDAHMTQFVLSPDCHVTLVKLHTLVSQQVHFYDCLISVEALLEKLKARTSVQQDKQVGQYCIEVLHVF